MECRVWKRFLFFVSGLWKIVLKQSYIDINFIVFRVTASSSKFKGTSTEI